MSGQVAELTGEGVAWARRVGFQVRRRRPAEVVTPPVEIINVSDLEGRERELVELLLWGEADFDTFGGGHNDSI